MKKAFAICQKDIRIILNDRAALLFMLLAPFLLTLGMGAVTGSFSQGGNTSGIADLPVIVINRDNGELGRVLEDVFTEEDIFAAQLSADEAAARQAVDDDNVAAVVLIPAGFSASLLEENPATAPVEVYTNPNRPISAGIVRSVTAGVISQLEIAPVSIQVTLQQLTENGLIAPQDIPQTVTHLAERLAGEPAPAPITIASSQAETAPKDVSAMAYLAPGLAIFFLMYTVTQGARSILAEREEGTLARMMVSPSNSASILGGKLLGIFVVGFAQVMILIAVSANIFQLDWGQPLAIVTIVAATVLAATGWGLLVAAFARQSWQVATFGAALMLLFGILGGSFIPVNAFGSWMRLASKITPHAWASDAFLTLGTGGTPGMIAPNIAALLGMAAILFVAAAAVARKRWVS
ncbi:MAG: ABC transporter permease [Chloroflexota bacterium]